MMFTLYLSVVWFNDNCVVQKMLVCLFFMNKWMWSYIFRRLMIMNSFVTVMFFLYILKIWFYLMPDYYYYNNRFQNIQKWWWWWWWKWKQALILIVCDIKLWEYKYKCVCLFLFTKYNFCFCVCVGVFVRVPGLI